MSKNVLFWKSAIVLTLGVSCVQAKSPKDYFDVISGYGQTPKMTEQPTETSYFDKMRNGFGNGMRSFGDWLRKDDTNTDLGKLSQNIRQAGCAYASTQTGGWVSSSFFQSMLNPLGNAFRAMGSAVRTVSETETLTRTLMNKANIHYSSSSFEVYTESLAVTKALAQKGNEDTFFTFLKGVANRGHKLDQEKLQEQYALETAKALMKESGGNEAEAKSTLRTRLVSFLEKVGIKVTEISNFVTKIFNKAKQIFTAEKNRG